MNASTWQLMTNDCQKPLLETFQKRAKNKTGKETEKGRPKNSYIHTIKSLEVSTKKNLPSQQKLTL